MFATPDLRREALDCERWNLLHPTEPAKIPYVQDVIGSLKGPVIAASDSMRQVPEMVQRWVPNLYALGTDGFGRSESRAALRCFFEVDAECIALAALGQLARRGSVAPQKVAQAVRELGIDPEKANPMRV